MAPILHFRKPQQAKLTTCADQSAAKPPGRNRSFSLVLATAFAVVSSAAAATDRGIAYVGGSAGGGPSGDIGAIVALPRNEIGSGLAVSISASATRYHYNSSVGRVRASASDAGIGLVYQFSGDWGWWDIAAGPRLNHLRLDRRDPDNSDQGSRLTVGFGTDGEINLDAARKLHFASDFTLRNRGFDARVGLGQRLERTHASEVGIEAGVQGDRNYTAVTVGLFASRKVARDLEAQVTLGAKREEGATAPYGSVELSLSF